MPENATEKDESTGSSRASRGELLQALNNLAEELGRTPKVREMNDLGRYSREPFRREFGSWNGAIKAAGLAPNSRQDVTEDELISHIKELGEGSETRPTRNDLAERGEYSEAWFEKLFGSWGNALEVAGYDPGSLTPENSTDELIERLQKLADELGRTPSREDMRLHGPHAATTYQRRFGSWNASLKAAGLEINQRGTIPKEDLEESMMSLAEELGRPPTSDEMEELGSCSVNSYQRVFGSWNGALTEMGFEPVAECNIPQQDLIDELCRVGELRGHSPRPHEMSEYGDYASVTYLDRFGSWDRALEAAGYDPIPESNSDRLRYGSTWREQRAARREKDEYRCTSCTMDDDSHERVYDRKLSVHHITPARSYIDSDGVLDEERAHRLSNLRTLCKVCHRKWEGVPIGPHNPN